MLSLNLGSSFALRPSFVHRSFKRFGPARQFSGLHRRTSRNVAWTKHVFFANRSNNDSPRTDSTFLDFVWPAAGAFALITLLGPLLGSLTPLFVPPLVITAIAAGTGILGRVAETLEISLTTAALGLVATVFGFMLIPFFLKFGAVALLGYFAYRALGGGGGLRQGAPDIDARDVTIDVEAETIDD